MCFRGHALSANNGARLGGLVGFVMALQKLFGGGSPVEYGVLGIGGGIWLLSSAVCILIRNRID